MSCGAAPRRLPAAPGGPMLEIEALAKSYAALQALHNISLRVDQARTVGLVGPNGSGKKHAAINMHRRGFQRRSRTAGTHPLCRGAAIDGRVSPEAIARMPRPRRSMRTPSHRRSGRLSATPALVADFAGGCTALEGRHAGCAQTARLRRHLTTLLQFRLRAGADDLWRDVWLGSQPLCAWHRILRVLSCGSRTRPPVRLLGDRRGRHGKHHPGALAHAKGLRGRASRRGAGRADPAPGRPHRGRSPRQRRPDRGLRRPLERRSQDHIPLAHPAGGARGRPARAGRQADEPRARAPRSTSRSPNYPISQRYPERRSGRSTAAAS